MQKMSRTYHCKYNCGFHRSRKQTVIAHEKDCKFAIIETLISQNNSLTLRLTAQETLTQNLQNTINVLSNQVQGLLKRKRRIDREAAIHNCNWLKDFQFQREFYKEATEKAKNMTTVMELLIQNFIQKAPIFYRIKSKSYIDIKGVIGRINGQNIGVDNVRKKLKQVPIDSSR